jgi:hypothetical protein
MEQLIVLLGVARSVFPETLDQCSVGEGKYIRSVERVEYPLCRISK